MYIWYILLNSLLSSEFPIILDILIVNFNIQLLNHDIAELQILNLRGALVETIDLHQAGQVKWSPQGSISGGVYFVRLMINGQMFGAMQKVTYLK